MSNAAAAAERPAAVEQPVERVAVSIDEAAKASGIGRTMFYELLKADAGPPTFYINKRRLVLLEDLRQWLRERAAAGRG